MPEIKIFWFSIYWFLSPKYSPVSTPINPSFEKNVELAKTWFATFEAEDMETISGMFAEEVEYQGAFYGMELMTTKDQVLEYMGGWHAAMDSITYTPENFLPGVDPETNLSKNNNAINMLKQFYYFLPLIGTYWISNIASSRISRSSYGIR